MNPLSDKYQKYLDYLRQKRARVAEELCEAKEKLAVADAELSAGEMTSDSYMKWLDLGKGDESSDESNTVAIIEYIKDCKNQKDALRKIALIQGGVVNATEAGRLISKAGVTKGKESSTISTVHRVMSESEDWNYLSPGDFRYLKMPLEPSAEMSAEALTEAQPVPEESAPTNNAHEEMPLPLA